jgi:hypothetical protein
MKTSGFQTSLSDPEHRTIQPIKLKNKHTPITNYRENDSFYKPVILKKNFLRSMKYNYN